MTRRWQLTVVLIAVCTLLVVSCFDPPEPPPVVLRLWRGLPATDAAERARVGGEATATGLTAPWIPASRDGGAKPAQSVPVKPSAPGTPTAPGSPNAPGAPAAGGTTVFVTRFDGKTSQRSLDGEVAGWSRVVMDVASETMRLAPFTPPTDGRLPLQRTVAWAAVTQLRVMPGEALSVTVVARTPGAVSKDAVPVAALVEMREALPPDSRFTPEEVGKMLDPRRHASHLLEAPLGPQPVELRTEFVVDSDSRYLAVYLLAPFNEPPKAVFVESVAVRSLPVTAHVAAGGEFPRLQRLADPGVVRVAFDRDEREGLLALPGAHWAFDLGPSATMRRLDLSIGTAERLGGDGPDASTSTLEITIAARGRDAEGAPFDVVLRESLQGTASPDDPAWQDLSLGLPASPDDPLMLTLSATANGDHPPLAVFGHPTVRAPRSAGPREPAGPTPQAVPPGVPRPNIVLISLDTLRPDRLGCYGGEAGLTPHLDALAASGMRFTQAESTSSYTLPSHGSMLTGQYPAFHGAVDIDDRLQPARSPFLAQLLAEAGWVTAAFTGGGYVSPEYGFATGFDRYSSNDPVWALETLRGRQLMETRSWERAPIQLPLLRRYAAPMIEEWIEEQQDGVPFFLFLHTYIVHNYAPDHAWLKKRGLLLADGSEAPFDHRDRVAFNASGGLAADAAEAAGGVRNEALRAKVVGEYLPYYDATVGMADDFVGGVLAALDRAGLAGNTLVIITADHGEEFGEHGFFGHGETLFETNTRIPLLVRLPAGTPVDVGGIAPAVVDTPISLVDLAPWILRIAGVTPDPRMAVRAPLAPDTLAPPARSQLFIELDTRLNRLSATREGAMKLHVLLSGKGRGIEPGGSLLFDLASDPGELNDLSAARVPERTQLADLLRRLHDAAEAVHPRDSKGVLDLSTLDPETIQNLIALGYLDASGQPLHSPPADPPDDAHADPPADPQR